MPRLFTSAFYLVLRKLSLTWLFALDLQKHRASKLEDDLLSRTVFTVEELAVLKRKFAEMDVDKDVSFPIAYCCSSLAIPC